MTRNAVVRLGSAVATRVKDSLPTLRREEAIAPERMRSVMMWYAALDRETPRREEGTLTAASRA